MEEDGPEAVPGIDFGPTLTAVLVIEEGDRLTWVDSVVFESIRNDDPFSRAIENLRARTARPLRRKVVTDERAAWFIGEDDGLSSGRLLLHDFWAELEAELPGELLVRVPLRGVVLCCSNIAADMACVDWAADQLIEEATASGAAVVGTSWLGWSDDGWNTVEL